MQIQNCTASFSLFPSTQQSFSNDQFLGLAQHGFNTEYNPHRFHAIIMRIRHGGEKRRTTAALIFQTGKVVLTGVPTPSMAEYFAQKVIRRICFSLKAALSLLAPNISLNMLAVSNVVGTYHHSNRLDIERMYEHLCAMKKRQKIILNVDYEAWLFPALRFKLSIDDGPIATCLVYISGRVILTGCREEDTLNKIFSHCLLPLIQKFTRK